MNVQHNQPMKVEVQCPGDAAFFKVTGIEDSDDSDAMRGRPAIMKQHILDVQAKAHKVTIYRIVYAKTYWITLRLSHTGVSVFSFLPGVYRMQAEVEL